jgi:Tfp pilus assembly protein PilN
LAGAGAVAVGLVALLYVGASGSVGDAQAQLDAASSRQASLQSEAAGYRDVTAVYAGAAAAKATLVQAMGQEVRWSRLLNDLSLTVPDTVWIKSLTFTQGTTAGAGTPAAPAKTATPGGAAALGNASFTGVGFSHDDVALWLESLAGQKGYADPYFSQSNEALIGRRKVVTFTSTTTVTADALSGRYTTQTGR